MASAVSNRSMRQRFVPYLLLAVGLHAQEFDVASVKPSGSNDPRTLLQVLPGGGLRTSGATLRFLVILAYDLRSFQVVGGPGWTTSDRFDIVATVDRSTADKSDPADPTKVTADQLTRMQSQMRPRLAALLADRFGLKIHREMRPQPIYELLVSQGGPRIETASGIFGGVHVARNQLAGEAAGMDMLCASLANQVGRLAEDRTGLRGAFNFKLNWASVDAVIAETAGTQDPSGPSIFTAVREQLGLELKATRAPAEVFVIDQVERPTAN